MKNKGFSLIELLVVVALIGILATVGVVMYNGFIDKVEEATRSTPGHNFAYACNDDFTDREVMVCNACVQNHDLVTTMVMNNYNECQHTNSIIVRGQFTNGQMGDEKTLNCNNNFATIASETIKSFTNYAKSPYEDLSSTGNINIMSYLNAPPTNGSISYYAFNNDHNTTRVRSRCNNKVLDDVLKGG